MTFYFDNLQSPTQINISKYLLTQGIEQAVDIRQAQFSDINLTLDEDKTIHLEYKHLLSELLQCQQLKLMPLSFTINDDNYLQVVAQLPKQQRWILKPSMLNNGQGIAVFNSAQEVIAHYQQIKRYSGEHVLQHYIEPPHLLDGHKYSFRFFVLITDFAGSYLYPNGYFNVAREKYQAETSCLDWHLTNEHLHDDTGPNVHQIPTIKIPNFVDMFGKIKQSIQQVIYAFESSQQLQLASGHAFSLFGFDYLLDAAKRPWLLEINHGPCFPIAEHPLQAILYQPFWAAVVNEFVLPIMKKSNKITVKKFLPLQ